MDRTARKPKGAFAAWIYKTPARFMQPRILLVIDVIALVAIGLVMVYSASAPEALAQKAFNNDAFYFAKRQLMYVGFGVIVLILVALVDYRKLPQGVIAALGGGCVGLLLYVLLFGRKTLGAKRWITLGGVQLQPSEFFKIYLIVAAAYLLYRFMTEEDIKHHALRPFFHKIKFNLLFIISLVGLALVFFQPDIGSVTVMLAAVLYIVAISGLISPKQMRNLLLVLLVLTLVGLAFYLLKNDYKSVRIRAWLFPWDYADSESYQLVQGYYAFGSGGLFGKGIGMSAQKYQYLPFAYNDYIFAIIGEELGFIGTMLTCALFGHFFYNSYKIAENAKRAGSTYGYYIAAGAGVIILIQFFINVCGVLGIIPASGKTLPFLSYGGSSVVSALLLVGVIFNVSIHSELPETEHDRRRKQFVVRNETQGLSSASSSEVADLAPRKTAKAGFTLRVNQNGSRRVDSHESARERLRSRRK